MLITLCGLPLVLQARVGAVQFELVEAQASLGLALNKALRSVNESRRPHNYEGSRAKALVAGRDAGLELRPWVALLRTIAVLNFKNAYVRPTPRQDAAASTKKSLIFAWRPGTQICVTSIAAANIGSAIGQKSL